MKVTSEEIRKMAELSRISVDSEKAKVFAEQVSEILQDFAQLENIDVSGVDPLVSPNEEDMQTREDVVRENVDVDMALDQAPELQGKLFRVPPVV